MHTWLNRREQSRITAAGCFLALSLVLAFSTTHLNQAQPAWLLAGASAAFALSALTSPSKTSSLISQLATAISFSFILVAAVWFAEVDMTSEGFSQLVIAVGIIAPAIWAGSSFGFGAATFTAAGLGALALFGEELELHEFDTTNVAFSALAAAVLGEASAGRRIGPNKSYLSNLKRLDKVMTNFERPSDIHHAAAQIVESTQELFNSDFVTAVLRSPEGELVSATSKGSDNNENDILDTRIAKHLTEAIGGTEPKIVSLSNENLLVSPIRANDLPAGAVVCDLSSEADKDYTVSLTKVYRTQLSSAIEHLYVFDELEKATRTDELTGIGNRKHANKLLESLNEGDALILLDLDGFKEVNDTMGHSAGDQVLLDLSEHLKACLRDSDTSARLGGDEFMVVAKRAFADPEAVADRILHGWDIPDRSTTLSAGVALHEPEVTAQVTYDRADEALYAAKEAGKNQSKLWLDSSTDSADEKTGEQL